MSEHLHQSAEVTVVFRQGTSLLIPPFQLPREERRPRETYKKALYRLSADFGVNSSIDRAIATSNSDTPDLRAYLIEPKNGELDGSEFFKPYQDIPGAIETHDYLSEVDKHILKRAFFMLEVRRPLDSTT